MDEPIIITEQLVREVLNFPDDENSQTKFPERMVKGCMLRMGYNGDLKKANYLKENFPRLYKFLIHSVLLALSHRKGGYDVMRHYQMNMVPTLVLNKKYNFTKIVFHYLVEIATSKDKPWLDEGNDLLVLYHMDNELLKQLARYHPNHPEPSFKVEFFGFIKEKTYQDPNPSYADELKVLEKFRESCSEWFLKEEKKKKGGKTTPKVQTGEGSSSQPKKRRKKIVETLLVDEPDEEEPEVEVEAEVEAENEGEAESEVNVGIDVRLSPNSERLLKGLNSFNAQKEKAAGEKEGDNGDKSSSSSSDEEIDETERAKRIEAEIAKEKKLKRKRREEKEDDVYVPSPEDLIESQTPSGGRKKVGARKSVVSPRAARQKLELNLRVPKRTPKTKQPTPPPSPPHEPSPPKSPHKSPPKQLTPPRQPSPPQSPFHLSPLHQSPQQIFQTSSSTQLPIQTTPGPSGYKTFPSVPTEGITLDEIGDFGFANDEQVKKLEKKVEEVVVENKRLTDHEKIIEMRVKKVESDNKSLLKKI
ncbi:hypothetical protein Hanom_Chr13g01202551 [Helianthus anomalus]